jgi:hypothetical protein
MVETNMKTKMKHILTNGETQMKAYLLAIALLAATWPAHAADAHADLVQGTVRAAAAVLVYEKHCASIPSGTKEAAMWVFANVRDLARAAFQATEELYYESPDSFCEAVKITFGGSIKWR